MDLRIAVCSLALAVPTLSAGGANAAEARLIDSYTCKDIMRETDANRQAATAFLHGYLLGKAGGTSVDLDEMAQQTDKFTTQCLDNPNAKALETMSGAKK